MASHSASFTTSTPFRKAAFPSKPASVQARCHVLRHTPVAGYASIARPGLFHGLTGNTSRPRYLAPSRRTLLRCGPASCSALAAQSTLSNLVSILPVSSYNVTWVRDRRIPFRAGAVVRADASELSARASATTTPPTDLTQALAVAGFLAVRYGNLHLDAELILKSLAVLQLLVAAIALATRGVHTDRVRAASALAEHDSPNEYTDNASLHM